MTTRRDGSEKKEYLDDKKYRGVPGVGRYGYKCGHKRYPLSFF
jgi:hypothetical protein